MNRQGYGLALGGGGARGVYEIGAWHAFEELGIEFSTVTGTSIGAINGAILLSAGYERALDLWNNLQIEQCLELSPSVTLKADQNVLHMRNARMLAKEIVTRGGLNTRPLRDLLNEYVDEAALRAHPTRFGLMTAALPEIKPQPLWIEDIPEGLLIDYLMASAHLPGLQAVQIDGRHFLDGGFSENVPLSMLRKVGIRRLVAVDLEPRPSVRSPLPDNTQLTFIHNRKDLGGLLDVTPDLLRRNQQLGYLDTLKAFDQLNGDFFAFLPAEYHRLIEQFGYDLLPGLEQAADAYGLDRTQIWQAETFVAAISERRRTVQHEYEAKRKALKIESKLALIRNGKLNALKLIPPLRLAFLIELTANSLKSDTPSRIPLKFFPGLSAAAQALQLIPDTAFDSQPAE
ncbi:MAG: patatin-like phospholipase family protein [Eubacteriales bacterium]|nr:patatin-like phospholipase family protein [Eubacteriales bacterium]